MSKLSRWTEWTLWLVGSIGLGYWGVVSAEAWIFNRIHLSEWAPARAAPVVGLPDPASGDVIGRIDITDVGIEAVLVEGVEHGDLKLAVGHVPGTAFPGETGNCVIAGHRDTFFRGLREIRSGHRIRLVSRLGEAHYEVRTTAIIEPEETQVLEPTSGRVLTLVTCYPFNYLGDAPQRFIVVADAIERTPREIAATR